MKFEITILNVPEFYAEVIKAHTDDLKPLTINFDDFGKNLQEPIATLCALWKINEAKELVNKPEEIIND